MRSIFPAARDRTAIARAKDWLQDNKPHLEHKLHECAATAEQRDEDTFYVEVVAEGLDDCEAYAFIVDLETDCVTLVQGC